MHWQANGYTSGTMEYVAAAYGADVDELRALYPDLRAVLAEARRRHLVRVAQILGEDFDEEAMLDEVFMRARRSR